MKHWLDTISEYGSPRTQTESDDGWLLVRKDWPEDFQFFLSVMNGCNFDYEPSLNIRIPIPWNDRPFFDDQISCVYGQSPQIDESSRGWLEATDVSMPSNTVAIAMFESNSLAVLSMRDHDYGTVYYWDWYHDYPWRGDFFKRRLKPVYKKFEDQLNEIFDVGESHPLHAALNEAANDAMLVRLADSFESFISMIQIGHDD